MSNPESYPSAPKWREQFLREEAPRCKRVTMEAYLEPTEPDQEGKVFVHLIGPDGEPMIAALRVHPFWIRGAS